MEAHGESCLPNQTQNSPTSKQNTTFKEYAERKISKLSLQLLMPEIKPATWNAPLSVLKWLFLEEKNCPCFTYIPVIIFIIVDSF